MDPLLESMSEHLGWVIIGSCFIVGMVLKSLTSVMMHSAKERSRREIAAYIAEGSMTPEQGERLMRAEISGRSSRV